MAQMNYHGEKIGAPKGKRVIRKRIGLHGKSKRASSLPYVLLACWIHIADKRGMRSLNRALHILLHKTIARDNCAEYTRISDNTDEHGAYFYAIPISQWQLSDICALLSSHGIIANVFHNTDNGRIIGRANWQGTGAEGKRYDSRMERRKVFKANEKQHTAHAKDTFKNQFIAARTILKDIANLDIPDSAIFPLTYVRECLFPHKETIQQTARQLRDMVDYSKESAVDAYLLERGRKLLAQKIALISAYENIDIQSLAQKLPYALHVLQYAINCENPAYIEPIIHDVIDTINRDIRETQYALGKRQTSQATAPSANCPLIPISSEHDFREWQKNQLTDYERWERDFLKNSATSYQETDYSAPALGYNRIAPFQAMETGLGI